MERKLETGSYDFLAILHRIYMSGERKRGGVDIIIDRLVQDNKRVLLLEYQLGGKYIEDTEFERLNTYSVLRLLAEERELVVKEFNVFPRAEPYRWFGELFSSLSIGLKFIRKRVPVCICSDPLNVLSGWILKLFGKVEKIYFHSVDYSDKRFKNCFLNMIYSSLYKFAVRHSDLVGVVSRRMEDMCRKLGVRDDKIIFIPNSPDFDSIPRLSIRDRVPYSLVVSAGAVVKKYKFDEAILILSELVKTFPNASLKVIGNTGINKDYFELLKKLIASLNLEKNVEFKGYLSRRNNLEEIAKCTIGLAAYSDDTQYYMRYADPLKIREYAACGLPIVADSTTPAGIEARDHCCGFIMENKIDAVNAIKSLWEDAMLYEKCSLNAVNWAKKFDKKDIIGKLVLKLESS